MFSSDDEEDPAPADDEMGGEALNIKYFCQMVNGKVGFLGDPTLQVVTELSAAEELNEAKIPKQRYVLVIDVSSSMGAEVGGGPESLLDRVKSFVDLVIGALSNRDSLAIVTFSEKAEVELPMTEMTDWAKETAKSVVKHLHPKETTNLESGLMTALDVISKLPDRGSMDCIVLFTDGETNTGEEDVEIIVRNFKEAQEKMNRKTIVPLSAFTIGQYPPVLLAELSELLGSEAFYWLNEQEDFESDMLLPMFLRESTYVTDVSIEFDCLLNFTFDVDSLPRRHLQKSSLSSVEYFIHSIPGGIKKHIPITIIPPEGDLNLFHGKKVVEVKITYLDFHMKERERKESIIFSSLTVKQCRAKEKREKGVIYSDATDGISAYTVSGNELDITWRAAQDAMEMILREDCRLLSVREFDNVLDHILEDGDKMTLHSIDQAVNGINEMKQTFRLLFGHRNKCTDRLDACANEWIEKLDFGKLIANPYNYGRIASLQSSISSEMPVPKGVYQDSHKKMYMPRRVRKKMRLYEKIVKNSRKNENFGTSKAFEGKTILLSESLRIRTFGVKRESLAELVAKHGGRPEYLVILNPYKEKPKWYVPKSFKNTVLACCKKDYEGNSQSIRSAKKAQIPLVREEFVFDCMKRKKFLKLESYFLNNSC